MLRFPVGSSGLPVGTGHHTGRMNEVKKDSENQLSLPLPGPGICDMCRFKTYFGNYQTTISGKIYLRNLHLKGTYIRYCQTFQFQDQVY